VVYAKHVEARDRRQIGILISFLLVRVDSHVYVVQTMHAYSAE